MSLPRDKKLAATKKASACYLDPTELLMFENDSLQRMATHVPWPAKLTPWKQTLLQAVGRSRNQGALNIHLSFEAVDPRAAHDAPLHIIELGAQLAPGGAGVSYFFSISKQEGQLRRGLRKINFDLDSATNTGEPKPAMHAQISGRRPPSMDIQHHVDSFENLHPKLDKPRIICLPKSFAMLTHMALMEYQSTDSGISKIVSDPTWLALVRAAEDRLLKTHFQFCLDWMNQAAFRSQSLLSLFYGLPKT